MGPIRDLYGNPRYIPCGTHTGPVDKIEWDLYGIPNWAPKNIPYGTHMDPTCMCLLGIRLEPKNFVETKMHKIATFGYGDAKSPNVINMYKFTGFERFV